MQESADVTRDLRAAEVSPDDKRRPVKRTGRKEEATSDRAFLDISGQARPRKGDLKGRAVLDWGESYVI